MKKILIVEDEAVIALELEHNIKSLGYDITDIVNNAEDEFKSIEKNRPDIILQDIRIMGDMDGIAAAAIVKERYNIPVVFCSAYADQERLEKAKITEPFGYLLKPIEDKDLKITLDMALYVDTNRKKRKDSELFLEGFLSQSPYPTWVSDRSGLMLNANPALYDLLNLTREQLIGVYNVFDDPQIPKEIKDKIHSVFDDGYIMDFELQWAGEDSNHESLKESTRVFIEGKSFPIKNIDGEIINAICTYQDVTERKKQEHALKESERLAKMLMDSLPHPAMLITKNRTVIASNKIARELNVFPGNKCWKTFGQSLWISDDNKDLIKNGKEPINPMCHFCLADGAIRDKCTTNDPKVETNAIYDTYWVHVEDDIFLHYAIDVTEKRKIEQALEKQGKTTEEYIDSLPGVFYVFDDKKILKWNHKWGEITGYSNEEISKMYGPDFVIEEDREEIAKAMSNVFKHGYAEAEANILSKEGDVIPYLFTGALKEIDGIPCLVGLGIDIRELIKARKILENSEKMLSKEVRNRTEELQYALMEAKSAVTLKDTFLANMSHELRTPLHHIISYSNLGLKRFDKAPEKSKESLENIRTASYRLQVLVEDLLDLSKLNVGQMSYNRSNYNLNQLIQQAIRNYSSTENNKNIIYRPDPTVNIYADPYRIAQVIDNLLSNASKFAYSDANIYINVTDLNTKVQIDIINEGIEIPEKELTNIFDPFIQSSLTKTGGGGTGLGLAICKRIIHDHQGDIYAVHNPSGAHIKIDLPKIVVGTY